MSAWTVQSSNDLLFSRPTNIWTETIPRRLELRLISALWLDAQCWKTLFSSSSNNLIRWNARCQKSHIICINGINNFNVGMLGLVDKDWVLGAPIYLPKAPIYRLLRDGDFPPCSCCEIMWIMWMPIIINKRMMIMVVLKHCISAAKLRLCNFAGDSCQNVRYAKFPPNLEFFQTQTNDLSTNFS